MSYSCHTTFNNVDVANRNVSANGVIACVRCVSSLPCLCLSAPTQQTSGGETLNDVHSYTLLLGEEIMRVRGKYMEGFVEWCTLSIEFTFYLCVGR